MQSLEVIGAVRPIYASLGFTSWFVLIHSFRRVFSFGSLSCAFYCT